MRSRAHVLGHPLHPMLIVFPTAIFPLMLLLDALQYLTGENAFLVANFWLAIAGVATTVAAMIPGIVDLAGIPDKTHAHRTAVVHFVVGLVVLAVYAGAVLVRWPYGSVPPFALAAGLDLAGTLTITAQGWFGGELVYRHNLAVLSREEGGEPTPFEGRGEEPRPKGPPAAKKV